MNILSVTGAVTRRSRTVAVVAAVCLSVTAMALMLVPLHRAERALQGDVLEQRRNLQQVHTLASTYGNLQDQLQTSAGSRTDLTASITASLQQAGIQASRMQLNPDGSLQLRFESVAFNQILVWLAQLEQEPGVLLVTVDVTGGDADQAAVSVTLQPAL